MRLSFPIKNLFLILIVAASPIWGVETPLQQIPVEDRQFLTDFFRGLLSQGPFAATLFGKKSAASFNYPPQLVARMEDQAFKSKFLLERKGWKTWEKYQPLFDFKKYLFLKLDREFLCVIFVNREKMLSVLNENREFLQDHFSVDPLREEMGPFLIRAFVPNFNQNNFHLAQGLLLGYGWESCFAFQERSRIEDTLAYFPYDISEFPKGSSAAPDSLLDGFPQDLIKKQSQFKESFSLKRSWSATNPFFCATSPGYMAFSIPYDSDTKDIKNKIAALYNSDHFLEDFITLLMQ